VEYVIEKRLRELRKEPPFAGLHTCPASSGDVSDEQTVRLVILRPTDTHKAGKMDSLAIQKAAEILDARGNTPRTYRNMLAFVAPDQNLMPDLKKAVRDLLSWESIQSDSVRLNLDQAQVNETISNIARCNDAVDLRLKEVYCWILVPGIDNDADMKQIQWDAGKLPGMEPIIKKAAAKMKQNEQIITKWAPMLLWMELENLLWKDSDHIQVKQLWEYLTTYCYLPRLASFSVLEDCIRSGIANTEAFALATSFDGDRYSNLKVRTTIHDVYPSDYLVKLPVAQKQMEQDHQPKVQNSTENSTQTSSFSGSATNTGGGFSAETSGLSGFTGASGGASVTPPPPPPAKDTRFFMSVKLDNTRVIRDLQKYLDEVITHLSSEEGCDVELSLEVNAQAPDGFSQGTIRTVSENCRTLRVDTFGFEK
jgi:hypothetical protein